MAEKESKTDGIFLEDKIGLMSAQKDSKTDGVFLSDAGKSVLEVPLTVKATGAAGTLLGPLITTVTAAGAVYVPHIIPNIAKGAVSFLKKRKK